MDRERLLASLRRLKHRVLAVVISSGLGWALVAGLALLLGCVWLDLVLDLPAEMRAASGKGALVLGGLLLLRALWTSLRGSGWSRLAQRLDEVSGTGGQIRSGIDLAFETRTRPALTVALADLAVQRAAGLARRVAPSSAVPARPVWWAYGSFFALCMGVGILVALAPRLAMTQWNRFIDP